MRWAWIILLLVVRVYGDIGIATNQNIQAIYPQLYTFAVARSEPIYLTVNPVDAVGNPVDLNGQFARMLVLRQGDGGTSRTAAAFISGASISGSLTAPAFAGNYYLTIERYSSISSAYLGRAYGATLIVEDRICCDTPASSASVSVTITGAVGAVQETDIGPATEFDYDSKILTLNTGFVGGAGGGSLAVFDYTGGLVAATATGLQFDATFSIETNQYGVLVSFTSLGGFPTNFTGTNITSYAPNWSSASPTQSYHVMSATTTQAVLRIWGAGGIYPGGYTEVWLAHPSALKLMTLTIEVGQGGYCTSNDVTGVLYEVPGGWPDGGSALTRSNQLATSGGGSSRVWQGTNLIGIAGGGGSGQSVSGPSYGAGGGSAAGYVAASPHSGQGGTSTGGGARATTVHATYVWTNSAGSYLQAGSPGWATNVTSSTIFCDGAGGGYYGGGGGIAYSAVSAGGGGGAGWYNAAYAYIVAGHTTRGSITYPPATEYAHYIAGRGQAINSRTVAFWGGHGLIIVEEQ